MTKFKVSFLLFIFASVVTIAFIDGCGKDVVPAYNVPKKYEFYRGTSLTVNTDEADKLIAMLADMAKYVKNGSTKDVDADKLKNMFDNVGSPFSDKKLNQKGNNRIRMSNRIFGSGDSGTYSDNGVTSAYYQSLFNELEQLSSLRKTVASSGNAGTISDGDNSYLLNDQGVELAEVLEKGLMGAILYNQSANVMLGDMKMNEDNYLLYNRTAGYSLREHNIDLAFGFTELPADISTIKNPEVLGAIKYWTNFISLINGNDRIGLDILSELHSNFRNIRACTSYHFDYLLNEEVEAQQCQVDESIVNIRKYWDLAIAGLAIHYLNETKNHMSEQAYMHHSCSQAIGFITALRYCNDGNGNASSHVDQILETLGSNIWELTPSRIENTKTAIAEHYAELAAVKDKL